MPIAEALAAFSGLIGLAEKLASAKSAAERNSALIEFQKALIGAQGITMSLQAENRSLLAAHDELEKQVVRLKDWSAEREQYELRMVAPGVFCQVAKGAVGHPEAMHKYCATCFEDRIKSILQTERIHRQPGGFGMSMTCVRCKSAVTFNGFNSA